MYKICLVAMLLLVAVRGYACDVCGCSMSSFSSDVFSLQNSHLVGLKYSTRSFTSEHPTLFENEVRKVSQESFQTLELGGKYVPVNWAQIGLTLPFHHFNRVEEGVRSTYSGIGDVALMAGVVLFSKLDTGAFDHRLTFNNGIKLPTGNNRIHSSDSEVIIPSMQPGTGSFDYLTRVSYMMRWMQWGAMAELGFRLNGANAEHFKFGNQLNQSIDLYRSINASDTVTIRPIVGGLIYYLEPDNPDNRYSSLNEYSGGTMIEARIGMNVNWKNWLFDARFAQPVYQHMGDAMITANPQTTIQLTYLIPKK